VGFQGFRKPLDFTRVCSQLLYFDTDFLSSTIADGFMNYTISLKFLTFTQQTTGTGYQWTPVDCKAFK